MHKATSLNSKEFHIPARAGNCSPRRIAKHLARPVPAIPVRRAVAPASKRKSPVNHSITLAYDSIKR